MIERHRLEPERPRPANKSPGAANVGALGGDPGVQAGDFQPSAVALGPRCASIRELLGSFEGFLRYIGMNNRIAQLEPFIRAEPTLSEVQAEIMRHLSDELWSENCADQFARLFDEPRRRSVQRQAREVRGEESRATSVRILPDFVPALDRAKRTLH